MSAATAQRSQHTDRRSEVSAETLPAFCLDAILRHNKADTVSEKRGHEWVRVSATEFTRRVRHIALGLADLGIKAGDRVALISENRPEWSIVDLAILSAGAVTVPLYTTQAVDQIEFILRDSGARTLLISGGRALQHARKGFVERDRLEHVIVFDPKAVADIDGALTLERIEEQGEKIDSEDSTAFDQLLARGKGADVATIIYTSGTTGEPKGVMLTHDNFISDVLSISDGLPILTTDVSLSVLPLSHIFERTVFYVFCFMGVSVHYAASSDHVAEYLREVRPTIMTAVPRLFESVYHRIIKKGTSAGGLKTTNFEWSLQVGQP